jgi:uncharacterized delta-60 repeat protein
MHFQKVVNRAAILLLSLFAAAELQAQSALDGFDPNADGPVLVTVVQPDGKILIGGGFTTLSPNGGPAVTRNHIARLNADGTLDSAFNAQGQTFGTVYSIALQADGKILVGGIFASIGGQPRQNIARLDPATGLADSFDPGANEVVYSIALQTDSKILVGGAFTNIGAQPRNHLARLDPTTGAADSFNPNPNQAIETIVIDARGRVLVGGNFTAISGQALRFIARLNPTSGVPDSFNPNASSGIRSIALQADGKILVGGYFDNIGGQSRRAIARLDPNSGLADSFDPGANSNVDAIMVHPNGKILVGGAFNSIGGQTRHRIARLDPVTGLADSFDPNVTGEVFSITIQPDGKILAAGFFCCPGSVAGQTRNYIARLEIEGRLDQTLDSKVVGNGSVVATVTQPDGKIVVGGVFSSVLGVTRHNIARLNSDGSLDLAFDPDASSQVTALAIQADGKIVVGGNFISIGGQARNCLARLDGTTGLADSFNPNLNAIVLAVAIQADGKILAGGSFQDNFGGQLHRFIARFDPTTSLADSFNPSPNNTVWSIAVQRDGKVLIGGDFSNIGGFQPRNRIARLDATTGEADSFNPNANNSVYSIAVQPDGKILAGGRFTIIGGQTRNYFARVDGTTGVADSFAPNADADVNSIAIQADGKILAGGAFTAIGGQARKNVARLDAISGLADSFNPDANRPVTSVAIQADGKILVGGGFSGPNSIGGQSRDFFARLSNDTAALQNLTATEVTVTWTRGGSSPQFARVTFEYSDDNMNFTPLGEGTPAGSDWILAGQNLPVDRAFYIRARGYHSGSYGNGSGSITESVRNVFVPAKSSLGNISTRLRVETGDNAMIGGFIITGTQRKTVIVRGIGPSLPIPGALADPVIEVYGSAAQLLASNDNWNDSLTRQQIIDSGLAPTNDLESALWGVIDPGAYTVVVRGKNNTTGIGLFEVYDLDQTVDSKLGNVSTRGFVETGDNVMIGGTIIVGNSPTAVLLRAIGPSLTNFGGVPNALGDPVLELHDGNGGLIAINYDWRDDQEAEIAATGIPPLNDKESAILKHLAPGNYTAIVRGFDNTTGVAVIEAFDVD